MEELQATELVFVGYGFSVWVRTQWAKLSPAEPALSLSKVRTAENAPGRQSWVYLGPHVNAEERAIRAILEPHPRFEPYVSRLADHSAWPYSPIATVPLMESPFTVPLNVYRISFPPTGIAL